MREPRKFKFTFPWGELKLERVHWTVLGQPACPSREWNRPLHSLLCKHYTQEITTEIHTNYLYTIKTNYKQQPLNNYKEIFLAAIIATPCAARYHVDTREGGSYPACIIMTWRAVTIRNWIEVSLTSFSRAGTDGRNTKFRKNFGKRSQITPLKNIEPLL